MTVFIAILVIGLFQSLVLVSLILLKRQVRQYPLLLLLLIISVGLGLRIALADGIYRQWPILVQFSDVAILLFGPAFYFFVSSSVKPVTKNKWKRLWWHGIPALAFLIHLCYLMVPLSPIELLQAEARGEFNLYYTILLGGGLLINIIYWWQALQCAIKGYEGPKKSRRFLQAVLSINAFTLFCWLIGYSVSIASTEWNNLINISYQLAFVSLSVTSIFIAYHALLSSGFWMEPKSEKKYSKSRLSQEDLLALGVKLNVHMIEQRAYLNADLALNDLSPVVGINKVQLSQVINQHFEKGFADWVNTYRIEEFIRRVESEEYGHFTYLGIALESGFNTKATFNKAFKKLKGKTPSEYFAGSKVDQPEAVALN